MSKWTDKQVAKYAGNNFGETNNVVTKNLVAYTNLLKIASPGMTFLDIGCNNGRVCFEMKKLGLKELGVDLPQIIKKCDLDFNKQALDLESDFPTGTYDLIFCREVIEHIQRYEEIFKLIFAALNENGKAIITAPFDKKDFGQNCPEHVRLFSKAELKQYIQKSGGKVLSTFREKVCRSIGCVCEKANI